MIMFAYEKSLFDKVLSLVSEFRLFFLPFFWSNFDKFKVVVERKKDDENVIVFLVDESDFEVIKKKVKLVDYNLFLKRHEQFVSDYDSFFKNYYEKVTKKELLEKVMRMNVFIEFCKLSWLLLDEVQEKVSFDKLNQLISVSDNFFLEIQRKGFVKSVLVKEGLLSKTILSNYTKEVMKKAVEKNKEKELRRKNIEKEFDLRAIQVFNIIRVAQKEKEKERFINNAFKRKLVREGFNLSRSDFENLKLY